MQPIIAHDTRLLNHRQVGVPHAPEAGVSSGERLDAILYGRITCAGGRKTGYASGSSMTTLQEIIDAARMLSPAERLRLVDVVWDDEHPENWPALSPEWIAEVQRRSAEFDAGRMKASPWEGVQARVRRKAGLDG